MSNKQYCIYIHINKINGKIYIGQTCKNPEYRWNNGKGYKNCSRFFNAIEKYGWDNFEHIIWADGLTLEQSNRIEELLIGIFDSRNPDIGYNLKSGGLNHRQANSTIEKIRKTQTGKKHDEETKRKLADTHRGMKHSEETKEKIREHKLNISEDTKKKLSDAAKRQKNRAIQFDQYTMGGVFIRRWESAKSVKVSLGIDNSSIVKCAKGKLKHAGGFLWKYVNTNNE